VVADPHLAGRHMLVEHPRTDGVAQPVLIPGLPIKFAEVSEGPETRVPWLGEHTDEVLADASSGSSLLKFISSGTTASSPELTRCGTSTGAAR
jgi:crotonobetainyl-CoA:carnitine CoA-transferase CaiB-like acyl-CoA transferase